jgi:hypothetical protein
MFHFSTLVKRVLRKLQQLIKQIKGVNHFQGELILLFGIKLKAAESSFQMAHSPGLPRQELFEIACSSNEKFVGPAQL